MCSVTIDTLHCSFLSEFLFKVTVYLLKSTRQCKDFFRILSKMGRLVILFDDHFFCHYHCRQKLGFMCLEKIVMFKVREVITYTIHMFSKGIFSINIYTKIPLCNLQND